MASKGGLKQKVGPDLPKGKNCPPQTNQKRREIRIPEEIGQIREIQAPILGAQEGAGAEKLSR